MSIDLHKNTLIYFLLITLVLSIFTVPGTWFMILPRESEYFLGIILAPVFHVDFQHWLGNMLLFVPGIIIIYQLYKKELFATILWIYLISGVFVWMFGEPGFHVGFSGVAIGTCVFILTRTAFSFNFKYFIFSIIYLFIHYHVLNSLFIEEEGISIDYHISGALAGLSIGIYFPLKKK